MVATISSTRTARLQTLRGLGPFSSLQIVPAFADHELLSDPNQAGAAQGDLTYHGGRLIAAGYSFVNVYLDAAAPDKDFDEFTDSIVEDGYYVSPDAKQFNGRFDGGFALPSGLTGTVLNSQLEAWLESQLGRNLPAAAENRNFALIVPPSLQVQFDGTTEESCTSFCGYHTRSASGIYYSVICDPGCDGCHGSFAPANARQAIQAHELGEWLSDPDGTGWYNDATGAENGDQCAWNLKPWGPTGKGWMVQPLWVNGGKACGDLPSYQPPPAPQHDWTVTPGDPLSPFISALFSDVATLSAQSPAGSLLTTILTQPELFAPGQPLAALFAWWQKNPSYPPAAIFDPQPRGAGWGPWLDQQGSA